VALDITDGPTTVVGTALIACAAAALFLARTDGVRLRAGALIAITVLATFVAVNSLRIADQASLLRVQYVKGGREPQPLFEKWNSFSRITVFGDPTRPSLPRGWGLSGTYPSDRGVPQLALTIDAAAATVLTRFDGHFEPVEHLKYDVTNIAHWLRRRARARGRRGWGTRRAVRPGLRPAGGDRGRDQRIDPRRAQRSLRRVHRPARP
jgi:hypothetical protein